MNAAKIPEVKKPSDARVWMEEKEICRQFFQTDRITFGSSELDPGCAGALDPGHSEGDEIFYCVSGHVLCYISEDETYYELQTGEALIIPSNRGHRLFNIGDKHALVTWSCAPHP